MQASPNPSRPTHSVEFQRPCTRNIISEPAIQQTAPAINRLMLSTHPRPVASRLNSSEQRSTATIQTAACR